MAYSDCTKRRFLCTMAAWDYVKKHHPRVAERIRQKTLRAVPPVRPNTSEKAYQRWNGA